MMARMERKAKRKKKKMVREKKERKKKGNYYTQFCNINFYAHYLNTGAIEDSSPIGLFEGDLGTESKLLIINLQSYQTRYLKKKRNQK